MAKSSKSAKQRRESKRLQRQLEKRERLQRRRELREQGLDPDNVDKEGNPLPYSDVAEIEDIAPPDDSDGAPTTAPRRASHHRPRMSRLGERDPDTTEE
jgi:hypothetical protein